MNLLSDKIAITYGSLNMEPPIDASFNRYTTVNDFAFIDDENLVCINIGPNLFINCKTIVFIDPETGEDLEVLPYMDMTEEEFFQYTTVYDFGACDFDDITFVKKHICALQAMSGKFREKVSAQFRKMQNEWENQLAHEMANEITNEIDNEILRQLHTMEWKTSTPPAPLTIQSPRINMNMINAQIIADSSVSFTAMNQGNP